jgi:hypothetical protein
MDRDKMREEIAKMLDEIRDEYCLSDHESRLVYSDRILSLLAPVFEKAEKYEEMLPLTEYMAERARKWDQVTRYYPNVAAYITDPVRYTRKKEVKDA